MTKGTTKATKSHMRAGKTPIRLACVSVKRGQTEEANYYWQ